MSNDNIRAFPLDVDDSETVVWIDRRRIAAVHSYPPPNVSGTMGKKFKEKSKHKCYITLDGGEAGTFVVCKSVAEVVTWWRMVK